MLNLISTKMIVIILIIGILLTIQLTTGICMRLKPDGHPGKYRTAAIVSNVAECAQMGRETMKKGGSVADVTITTLLCEGVSDALSMGIGGGFLATIYIKSKGYVETLVARETAPLAAHENMFVNKSVEGGLAVAVPGEIKGYYELHKNYGNLSWCELFEPVIKLCEDGHLVTKYMAKQLIHIEEAILKSPSLREIYIDSNTGRPYREGDRIKRIKLAQTFRAIARDGVNAIYGGGNIGRMLVEDIRKHGGIITEADLKQYRVRWVKPVTTRLNQYAINSIPLPGSGLILSLILNLIWKHIPDDEELLWHRIVEAFKHGYGQRTQLGDIEFLPEIRELVSKLPTQKFADELRRLIKDDRTFNNYDYYGANYSIMEDHGTANVAILGSNGDAITVTSTINMLFGANFLSEQTGIILNNEMDDFSIPGVKNGFGLDPSPANFIRPGKMPLSSMCPTIVLDKDNNVRLLIGAAGGSTITTSVAQTMIRHLMLNETIEFAVDSLRLHHQLSPMEVQYEENYNPIILESLKAKGHIIKKSSPADGFSALTAIEVNENGEVKAAFDKRRGGGIAYCHGNK